MSEYPLRDLTTTPHEWLEAVEVEPVDVLDVPQSQLDLLSIDVIHDGRYIPAEFLVEGDTGRPITIEELEPDYIRERDWGASLIAARIAARLGLPRIWRVTVARVLMDYGRFPGSTEANAAHLERFAINYPFSERLSYRQKRRVLEDCYDNISAQMERVLAGKLIKIAVHTYDRHNPSGTERPATSLLTRTLHYQNESELPAGLYDPLFPDVLAEFTSDRILRDRISLSLEKALIPVAHNYPYCLPEGSLEVRYQVWAYFQALREVFEEVAPDARGDEAFELVWSMLLDTNLRSSDSEALRSTLHMFRRPPVGREALFERAADAYARLCAFARGEQGLQFVQTYRFSPLRASSLGVEVRKDLITRFDDEGRPIGVKWANVRFIGDTLATAIATYLREDRHGHASIAPEFIRQSTWAWSEDDPRGE